MMVGKKHGKIGLVDKRHMNGNHSNYCKVWDWDYHGYVCKYSWEPLGKTALELAMLATKPRKSKSWHQLKH